MREDTYNTFYEYHIIIQNQFLSLIIICLQINKKKTIFYIYNKKEQRYGQKFHRSENRNVNKHMKDVEPQWSSRKVKMRYNFVPTKLEKKVKPSFDGDVKQVKVFYTEDKRVKCTATFGK